VHDMKKDIASCETALTPRCDVKLVIPLFGSRWQGTVDNLL